MDSSANRSDRAPDAAKGCDTTSPDATKQASSRRTVSLSSSSSFSSYSSSYFPDDRPPSPATPLRRFYGVPFSWEHLPGIPKKPSYKKKDTTLKKVLPLPPPLTLLTSKRFNSEEIGIRKKNPNDASFQKDPFVAALVECSKDDDDGGDGDHQDFWSGPKASRSISDRFGFINLYSSCKRGCSVSESLVNLPRSSRTSYDLITHRPHYHQGR